MKKVFEEISIEVIVVENEDIVTTSNFGAQGYGDNPYDYETFFK